MFQQSSIPIINRLVSLFFRQQKQLQPERMIAAYREGCFPMTRRCRFGLIQWINPKKHAIIPLDDRFKIGKRLTKKIQSNCFELTFDSAFHEVIQGCAEIKPDRPHTWILPALIEAYTRLYELVYAHRVEVWREGKLVGGEFGVAINGYYSGESLFTREDYAGRVAMVYLVNRLRKQGFTLLDTQHLSSIAHEFGAFEVERAEYMRLLADALECDVSFNDSLCLSGDGFSRSDIRQFLTTLEPETKNLKYEISVS